MGAFLLLLSQTACKEKPAPQLFFGECSVQVESKTAGAEIIVDGILVGQNGAKLNIPCGEKQVRVVKEGYVPYTGYHMVSVEAPIKVSVELEHVKHGGDFALSTKLVDLIRRGKKVRDPSLGLPEENAPDAIIVAAAGPAKSDGAAAGGGAAAGQFSTNVEDWR